MKILSQFLISRLKMEYKIKEIEHIDILLFYYTIISIVEHMKYNQEIPEKSNIAFNFCIAFAMTDHSNTCRT